MRRATPWAALALLAMVTVISTPSPSAAIRMDLEGDLDVDYDHPHEHHKDQDGNDKEEKREEDEELDDDDVELDLGPGRPFRRVRIPRMKDTDWDLNKLLNSEDPMRWQQEMNDPNFEDILSKYTSEMPEELDEWD